MLAWSNYSTFLFISGPSAFINNNVRSRHNALKIAFSPSGTQSGRYLLSDVSVSSCSKRKVRLSDTLHFQCRKNCRIHFLWRGHRSKTLQWFAVAANQKLSKVPLNTPSQHAGQFIFQITKQRVRCATVNLNLLKHREAHAVVDVTCFRDFVGAAGFLFAELVTGEAQHHKPLIGVFLV